MCLTICLTALFLSSVAAEDWPAWRGPRGDGSSAEEDIPTTWNGETGAGVIWKVPVPGVGHSSPVVHGTSVFVTTCDVESLQRVLLCYDTETGNLRWRQTVVSVPLEHIHKLNS